MILVDKNKYRFAALTAFFFFVFVQNAFSYQHAIYEIKANVDVEQKTIFAKQVVTFTNNSSIAVDELFFHIYPNRYYTKKEKKFMLNYGSYFHVNPLAIDIRTNLFRQNPIRGHRMLKMKR